MDRNDKLLFDDWLWEMPQAQLDALALSDLALAATEAGVDFPQISATTAIVEDRVDPIALLANGVGVDESRHSSWGGLLRASLKKRRYTVAVRKAGDGVLHVMGSVPFTERPWERVDSSWIPRAHPQIAGVILNRDDFEALGDLLGELGEVHVNRMTARVLRDGSSYSRGWSVMQPGHREALSEAASGMIVNSLSLSAGASAIHLRRSAGATFYKGDWPAFVKIVLGQLAAAADERRRMLSDRGREADAPVAETLVMELQPDVAAAPSTRERILAAINDLRGARTAVLHANPYLHLIATDHLDGSSFDILITNDHRLTIVPGLRTSTGSLARITDAVGLALGMDALRLEPVPEEIPAAEIFAV
ncbi:MAG: hypothetical protein ACOYD4_06625 [Solirubrobacterales bacterium]